VDKQYYIDNILNAKGFDVMKAWEEVCAANDKQLVIDVHQHIATHLASTLNDINNKKSIVLWISDDGARRVDGYLLGDNKVALAVNFLGSPQKLYEQGIIPYTEIATAEHQWSSRSAMACDISIDISQISSWLDANVQNAQNTL
tara:strand:+ start:18 stop:449 length:432 start_codon:yes stop_codon:yes gene_type:complete